MRLIFRKRNKLKDSLLKEDSMQYESALYWFRDYWSNRLKLNRNVQAEDFRIDVEKDFPNKELTVENTSDGKCNVQWPNGKFDDLMDPFKLVRQFEPQRISFPFSRSGLRDESPDPNLKIGGERIEKVAAEPIVQAKGEVRLWLKLLIWVFLPSLLLMLIEWAVLDYINTLIPELFRFTFLIMALTLAAFLYLSVRIMIKIGVSETTRKPISAKATIYFYHGEQAEKYHYRYPKDKPDWLESKPYWVFRYLFIWSSELTLVKSLPLIQGVKDFERLDAWFDAKTGTIEWMVSDYHWRELWYRTDPTLNSIRVWLSSNFHTPRPLNISIEGKGTLSDLYRKEHPISKQWMEHVEKYRTLHSKFVTVKNEKKRLGFLKRAVVSELIGIWWEKWRYQQGANNPIYKNSDVYATGEQPSLPAPATTIVPSPTPTPKPIPEPTPAPMPMPTVVPAVILTEVPKEATIAPQTTVPAIFTPIVTPTNEPTVKQTPTIAISPIAPAATSSPSIPKKHSGSLRYAGLVVGAIAAVAIIGFFMIKKGKRRNLIKSVQTEPLAKNDAIKTQPKADAENKT